MLVLWWRNRNTEQAAASPTFNDQVGSNISEDVSSDVIGKALDFAGAQIDKARCYRIVDSGLFASDGMVLWAPAGEDRNSANAIRLPRGQIPKNACGY